MTGGAGESSLGVIPRAADLIFDRAARLREQGWTSRVVVETLEVYNDTLRDLLAPGGGAPELREAPRVGGGAGGGGAGSAGGAMGGNGAIVGGVFVVEGLVSKAATSPQAVHTLRAQAVSSRATGATAMNASSSRSHFIFTLRISSSHEATRQSREGTLTLVDLAGSEKLSKSRAHDPATGGSDKLLKETQAINLSLSALGDVVSALQTKAKHVPFRNSKLTQVLQDALGSANARTLFICALNPLHSNTSESLSTLRFAERLSAVTKGVNK